MVNFCGDCGYALEENWKNCPKCGQLLQSTGSQITKPIIPPTSMNLGVRSFINWAELRGEGAKVEEFARAFINEMISYNIKCQELPSAPNEINLKLRAHPFLIGKFQAVNKNNNLYYKARLHDNNKLFYGIMGLMFIIGLIIFLSISTGFSWFFMAALPVWWFFIGGGIVGASNKPKKNAFPYTLKAAESEIRSI